MIDKSLIDLYKACEITIKEAMKHENSEIGASLRKAKYALLEAIDMLKEEKDKSKRKPSKVHLDSNVIPFKVIRK